MLVSSTIPSNLSIPGLTEKYIKGIDRQVRTSYYVQW